MPTNRLHLKRITPKLEKLEERTTPAVIQYTGSLLSVTMNKSNTLTVTESITTSGTYTVTEGSTTVGTFITSGITIIGTNSSDIITVSLRDNNTGGMSGILTIRSGNGNDTVSIVGGSTNTPVIRGGINADLGYGDDILSIGDASRLTVRGTTVTNGNLGSDTLNIGTSASAITGTTLTSLSSTDFNIVTIGPTATGTAAISQTATITPGTGSMGLIFTLNAAGTINKGVITGTSLADTITLNGVVSGNLSSGGDALTVTTGLGNDSLSVGTVGSNTYNTGLTFNAGDGTDTFTTTSGSVIGGDLTLNMVSTVNDAGNTFNFATGTQVYGNLTISEITSANYGNVGPANQSITFNGQVNGDVNLRLGDSDHTISFTLAAIGGGDYSGYLSVSNYTNNTALTSGAGTGTGDNTVTFDVGSASVTYIYTILLGSGNDAFTFTTTAGTLTLTGRATPPSSTLNGGGGTNTLTSGATLAYSNLTKVNFT